MAHIYDIGTRAWQPDATEGWVASEVTDKQIAGDKVTLVFKLENGEVGRPPPTPATASTTVYTEELTWNCADQDRRDNAGRYPDGQ